MAALQTDPFRFSLISQELDNISLNSNGNCSGILLSRGNITLLRAHIPLNFRKVSGFFQEILRIAVKIHDLFSSLNLYIFAIYHV